MEKEITIAIREYDECGVGSLLVKKDDGKWHPTTFDELNAQNNKRLKELEKLPYQYKLLAKQNKRFVKYAKSHFLLVAEHLILKGMYDQDVDLEKYHKLLTK